MYEAMYIAATGLYNQQRRVDTIADNVANVNTVGFKAARLDFKDALYTSGLVPGPAYSPAENQQKGHGLMIAQITKDFSSGAMIESGNQLDFAINGDAFFEIEDPYGRLLYTRNDTFYMNASDDGFYLVDGQGYYLHNDSDARIQVPENTTRLEVSEDGSITFFDGDTEILTDRFGLYTFPNRYGLSYSGSSNYEPTVASGDRIPATDVQIKQGYVEASNVELAEEMSLLIRSQRAFSLAGRALTTADDMEGLANSMKR